MKYPSPYAPDFSNRDPLTGVAEDFPTRWSPRSFVKTAIPAEDLEVIFDAARWAPSAYNEQPWNILTSTDETFETFLGLLVEANRKWAVNASLIGFMVARRNFTQSGKPNPTALYDCGSAWMSLTLQARKLGLYTHGMSGIRRDAIYEAFGIDRDDFEVVAGFTIGVLDLKENLGKPYVDWESPSPRKPLAEIWKQGVW
ncbi:nitroreductase [Desulfomicrobium macestii]|uniref:Nitroreductase n=2 Tax=Desulfomicrobium TaxID=898 RepID=A0A8G2C0X3_DESNO|nr:MULTISPECIES: nitroreductase family protein [Desulfomicrobium]MBE1423960.1 nitroreductase [Desulfomicrobium macestii]SFL43101.1 Nitroreductase [Desulfomicrobium norvegicum]